MNSNEPANVATLTTLPWARGLLVDRCPAWTDVFYCRTWKSDAVSSHCGICTELHCRMCCCEI